ncbi:MAG: S58 family peptidase [Candidatus Glassbacteria bacterium]|nr:S58 family peptidase [Candidatus Glassbacteria bacterium]
MNFLPREPLSPVPPPDNSHRPRVRELGLEIGIFPPGKHNAITDVPGVSVGQVTLWHGDGPLQLGVGPVRTGVTAVIPHPGNTIEQPLEAAADVFNGVGTSIGLHNVREVGLLETPIVLTNTMSVGTAYEALTRWCVERYIADPASRGWIAPVVGETCDACLNDIYGFHVRPEHVLAALDNATDGPVAEGVVGAGTGVRTCGFKAGIGTASRLLDYEGAQFTLGALVQSNFPGCLAVDGVPVGRELGVIDPEYSAGSGGSIMAVIATDIPLDSRQLGRVARRSTLGMTRAGANGSHRSGDFYIAFSTGCRQRVGKGVFGEIRRMADEYYLTRVFQAAAEAVEEAILNSAFKAVSVTGRDGNKVEALDLDRTRDILQKHGRRLKQ